LKLLRYQSQLAGEALRLVSGPITNGFAQPTGFAKLGSPVS
jgi:hypothetical protein